MPSKTNVTNNGTLATNGKPKRKRVRNRRRGGAGGAGRRAKLDSESSSSEDDSSDSDSEDIQNEQNGNGKPALPAPDKGKGKAGSVKDVASTPSSSSSSSSSSSDSESDSSTSSFLSSSSAETSHPTAASGPDAASIRLKQSSFAHANDQINGSSRKRVRTPPREPSPPYLQFGSSEMNSFTPPTASTSYRAIGKPILWGLLPHDLDTTPIQQEAILEERQRERYAKFRQHYVSRLIDRFGGALDDIRKKEGQDLKESRLAVLIKAVADGSDAFTSKDGTGIWKVDGGKEFGEKEIVLEAIPDDKDGEEENID